VTSAHFVVPFTEAEPFQRLVPDRYQDSQTLEFDVKLTNMQLAVPHL
jgi:hypothetical protein